MAPAALLECSFLMPIRRDRRISDGELHSTDTWEWLTDQVYERFEAVTVAPGLYEGLWKDPVSGERVPDQSRKYILALPEEKVENLRQLLRSACVEFHQQCIYLSIAGQVEFVEGPGNASP